MPFDLISVLVTEAHIFTACTHSLREGNVFSYVCLSVNGMVVCYRITVWDRSYVTHPTTWKPPNYRGTPPSPPHGPVQTCSVCFILKLPERSYINATALNLENRDIAILALGLRNTTFHRGEIAAQYLQTSVIKKY